MDRADKHYRLDRAIRNHYETAKTASQGEVAILYHIGSDVMVDGRKFGYTKKHFPGTVVGHVVTDNGYGISAALKVKNKNTGMVSKHQMFLIFTLDEYDNQ